MRRLLPFAMFALSAVSFGQDTVSIPAWKPSEGEVRAWKVELKFTAMNQEGVFTGTAQSKVLKVNADGTYEAENWMDDGKVKIMGSEQEQPGDKHVVKFDKTGQPLEKKDFTSSVDEMLSVFTDVTTPEGGVKVGDKWVLKDKFDRIGKGEGELLGDAEFLGKKCLAFHATYSPKDGGTCDGKVYLTKEGLFLGFELTYKEVTVAPGIQSDGSASMKLVSN